MAVKKQVEEAGIPTFMTVGGDPVIMGGGPLGTFKWVFKSPQRSSTAVEKLYQDPQQKEIKKIALITASDGFGERTARSGSRKLPQVRTNDSRR